nr:retrovirus-related Pol polyprotein from transposon TNT 1-94 [Tanacetum cinerariifolium]
MTLKKNELFQLNLKDSSKRVLKGSVVQKQLMKLNATDVREKSSEHKLELKHTKDFEAKYNKVKAKLALLSSSASASNSSLGKNKECKHSDSKENKYLRNELKELTSFTETWLNSSNKVNQCISEQIPSQKKKILEINQLTKDTSSSRPKDFVFVKSLAYNSNVSITSSNKTRLSKDGDFTLPNHDTGKVPLDESQRNTTDPPVVVFDSSATDYDSPDESLVCSTPLPPLKNLVGAKPVSGPKTIKSILKSKSTFKAEVLKGVIINEPSSAPAKGISTSVSKTNSAPAGKLKNVKMEDGPPFAIVNQHHTGQGESSSRSRPSRPTIPFPSCIHSGYNDHQFDACVYYPICEFCGSYDHDTHGHNMVISLRSGINLETLNMSQRTVKYVVATFIPQLITITLNGLGKEKLFKLRNLRVLKQIKQFKRGISINQEKYVKVLLKKNDINGSSVKTPMVPPNKLGPDLNGKAINKTQYRGMIGSLMYLTASGLDI